AQPLRRHAHFPDDPSAEDALRERHVDHDVDTSAGLEAGRTCAQALMRRGPEATELTKMLINAAEGEEVERVLEAFAGRIAAGSDDLREGLAAFRAKRKPDFRN
ncbi:MAG: enoyl-CoA hydratase/isomerase family protein, partial [Bauldia litoralis]